MTEATKKAARREVRGRSFRGQKVEEVAEASSSSPSGGRVWEGKACAAARLYYRFRFFSHTKTPSAQKIKPRQPTSAERLTSERERRRRRRREEKEEEGDEEGC